MIVVIRRMQEDARHQQLPDQVEKLRAISLVKHLEKFNLQPEDYDKVYEQALLIYNTQEGTELFGINHFIKAAIALTQKPKQNVEFVKPEEKVRVKCNWCKDSRIEYHFENGEIKGLAKGKNGKLKRCTHCR